MAPVPARRPGALFPCTMSYIWPAGGSAGVSLLDMLLATAIVATLAALSIPVTTGALDEMRTAMAARYVEGRIIHARAAAIRRSARVALRFEVAAADYRFGEYADGNGRRPVDRDRVRRRF